MLKALCIANDVLYIRRFIIYFFRFFKKKVVEVTLGSKEVSARGERPVSPQRFGREGKRVMSHALLVVQAVHIRITSCLPVSYATVGI